MSNNSEIMKKIENLLYNLRNNDFTQGGEKMDVDKEIDEVTRIIRNFLHVNVAICQNCQDTLQ